MKPKTQIMDDKQVARSITRIAHEIIERNHGSEDVCLVGIHTRGEPISRMLAEAIYRVEGVRVPVGSVDITFYRDDLSHISRDPTLNRTDISFSVEGKTVVLVDRGHRELPIRADFVGKNIPTAQSEFVRVNLAEVDGSTDVWLFDK